MDEKKINTNTMLQMRCLQNMMNPQMLLQLFYIYLILFNGGCWERNSTETPGNKHAIITIETNLCEPMAMSVFPFFLLWPCALTVGERSFLSVFTDHIQSAKVPVIGSYL